MSFHELGVLALTVYLLVLLGVAEVARRARRDDSPSDHFLAGRDIGTFVLFLTLYATAYSGNSLLGYPGRAYRSGFSFVMATGFMMAIIVCFHAVVPKLRPLAVTYGFVTPGDFIRHRFVRGPDDRVGTWLVRAIGLLMALALANFLLAQLKAMGDVTSLVTGGIIPYEAGVIGLALLILFYETRGGMRAVAWTDAAQGILMLVGLAALLFWLLRDAGGLEAVTRSVEAVRPSAVQVPDSSVIANWFSTIVLLGVASVVYPQALQRVYAARSGQALRRSFALMAFMPLTTTIVVTLIGIAAIARIQVTGEVDSDGVMPLLLTEWAASGIWASLAAVIVFLGALAAIMSTADSCLLSLGSLLAGDLLGRSGRDAGTTRFGKGLAALLLLATIPFALSRELTLWRLIELKMELLIQCAPAFFLALHWKRLWAGPVLAGVIVGTAFGVGLTLFGVPRLLGIHVGVIGLGLNVLVAIAGTLLMARPGTATPR